MDYTNFQFQYLWDMFKDNYEIFDKHARKILEEVKKDPSRRDRTAGIITGLDLDGDNMFRNTVPSNLEIPADALLRIYLFNYEKIQEHIHNNCNWKLNSK